MGDDIHEKEIDTENTKMSGLNQHKEENVGFVSNLTSVCVSYNLIYFWLYLKNIYSCSSEVFCISPRRLVVITIFLTLPCLLMLIITAEACKQMLLQSSEFCFLTAAQGISKHIIK